ncbi:hypothetical protein HII31_13586 [Pseudocercospora fuligena]|uniref:Uncharacterized protein n=1 Tax=Pseudocercospora fuligena TaxID=685502 RepID=A0A8H6VAF2_9PEZI|nr:hypothetical protein HII31_13586 [Pseudocercospora fuligena]
MLPTPPPTEKKPQGLFAERQRKLRHYEDAYGRRNADEGAEGPQDLCESEPDSENELQRDEQHRRKTPENQRCVDQSGEPGEQSRPLETDSILWLTSCAEQGYESDISEDVYLDRPQFKIAPNINRKRSLTDQEYDTARSNQNRLGMFGSAAASSRKPQGKAVDSSGLFMSGGRGRGLGESSISLAESEENVFNERPASKRNAKRARELSPDSEDVEEAPRKRTRIRRPAHRQLIQDQLQDKARQDRAARRAAVKASKPAKSGKAGSSSKKELARNIRSSGKSGNKVAKSGTMPALVVVIDNSHINLEEYERFE